MIAFGKNPQITVWDCAELEQRRIGVAREEHDADRAVGRREPEGRAAARERGGHEAVDRAHRIGQDRPVLVTRLVAADTVEERILALQERKRGLGDAALGGASTALTREDLLALLD